MAELNPLPELSRKIAQAQRHLTWPRLFAAFGWVALAVALFGIVALLGVFEAAHPAINASAFVILLLGGGALAWRGWRMFRPASVTDAERALDAGSELRPLASLKDRPARITPEGQSLWQRHRDRLTVAALRLKLPSTKDAWRRADPFYLRAAVPVALFAALAFAGPLAGQRVMSALQPDVGTLVGADDLRVDAWITPPDYTNRAPVFLTSDMSDVETPVGSELTVRAVARSAPRIVIERADGSRDRVRLTRAADGAWESVVTLSDADRFSVDWWGERAAWTLDMIPDALPTARFVTDPVPTPLDKTEFKWIASDDYGVEQVFLELTWQGEDGAEDQTDRVEIILDDVSPVSIDKTEQIDLTRHKWAGLELSMRLVSVDAAGQEGYSQRVSFKLPNKLLLQPLARAAQEVRLEVLRETDAYPDRPASMEALTQDAINFEAVNRLDTAPDGIQRAALMLDGLTWKPEGYFSDLSIYLGLRHARNVLNLATSLEEAAATDDVLWTMALRAEYGSVADAATALMAARRALERALREGASEEEIRRLTEAFKEAAKNYIAAKMAEAMMNPDASGGNPLEGMDGEMGGMGGPSFGAGDLQDMLDALSDLTETGAADQARQLLSDITNLLEGLEFQQGGGGNPSDGFPMPGQEGEGEDGENVPENEQAMRDILERLAEILGDQRQLNDDTMRSGQRDPFQNPGEGESEQDLAERQNEIGRRLSELEGQMEQALRDFEGENGERLPGLEGDQLDEARRAQRRAEDALERGDFRAARRFQDEATEALGELAGDVARGLDEMRGGMLPYDGQETDPFGNPVGGMDDSNTVQIPEESERQRAKDILEELRRRFSDTEDENEKDYLERLLDRF